MNLNIHDWKEFKVSDLFNVKYGVNLELNACDETTSDDSDAVNFVSRSRDNNGVTAYICKIDDIEPQKSGLISVAGGGSSVLSTFVQLEPFYSGRDLYTLESKEDLSFEAKLFITTVIEQNKYKYSFGRQANKTLPDLVLKLPVDSAGNPDYQFMEDYIKSLHYKNLTTQNEHDNVPNLYVQNWKEFKLDDYFDIVPGKYHYPDEYEEGSTPYYSASNENNSISDYISLPPDFEGNCVVTGKIGCTAFYAPEPFCATSDVNIFKPKFNMSCYVGLFLASVINFNENYKWAYGRQCRVGNSKRLVIKLPVDTEGNPDWQFMEDYMKALPYGDRLKG